MASREAVSSQAGAEMTAAIELEQLEVDLYRSVRLWKPVNGRGAFGGQVIGQATWAATQSVDRSFVLHSLHAYFLTFGDCTIPIVYSVDRVRDGRSYATRIVKAIQRGKAIFTLNCSFQVPETDQPAAHEEIPKSPSGSRYPDPESCQPTEARIDEFLRAQGDNLPPRLRTYLESMSDERSQSRIEVRSATPSQVGEFWDSGPIHQQALWMRCRGDMLEDDAFRKCVIAYLSDLQFIGLAPRALGLYSRSGPRLSMLASLDHSLHFYRPHDPSQWMLYHMTFRAAAGGRALVQGSVWSEDGKLVAVALQEGVVRASQPKNKL